MMSPDSHVEFDAEEVVIQLLSFAGADIQNSQFEILRGLHNLDHEAGVEPAVVVLQTTSLPFADSWKIGALGETRTLMPVGRAF
jgi:hypothetical protein